MPNLDKQLRTIDVQIEAKKAKIRELNELLDKGKYAFDSEQKAQGPNCILTVVTNLNDDLNKLRKQRQDVWESFYHSEPRTLVW